MTIKYARCVVGVAVGIALAPLGGCSSPGEGPLPETGCDALPPRLPERSMALSAATAPDGRIYVVGARTLTVFDPIAVNFRTLTPAPRYLELSGAAFVDNMLMVVGTETWLYDPAIDSWSEGPNSIGDAVHERAVTLGPDGNVYTFGGYAYHSIVTTDAEVYDVGAGRWSALPPVPIPLHSFGAASNDERIFVIGMSSWAFADSQWLALPSMSVTRRWPNVVRYRGSDVLVFGGQTDDGPSNPVGDVELYDEAANAWRPRARLPVPVRGAAAATTSLCPDRVYVFGGSSGPVGDRASISDLVQVYGPGDSWVRAN